MEEIRELDNKFPKWGGVGVSSDFGAHPPSAFRPNTSPLTDHFQEDS
jgi:hypothetical protein